MGNKKLKLGKAPKTKDNNGLMNLASVLAEASNQSYLQQKHQEQHDGETLGHPLSPSVGEGEGGGTETTGSSGDINLSIEDEGTVYFR